MATIVSAPKRAAAAVEAPRLCRELVAALRSPACYPHPAPDIQVFETHISFVVLAGDYAYKIKKPVALGFVDFSSLEARRFYCAEELRLNRRTAPNVYLEVVPIAGPVAAPVVGGPGPAIEYAVRMRRFGQEGLLDRIAREGGLEARQVESLARSVARFHGEAARARPESDFGTPECVLDQALDNCRDIEALETTGTIAGELGVLRAWTLSTHEALAPTFAERRSEGFVRECHGDLHLANVVLLEGEPVPFDCIEFDARLRWIDVMSEVAFTVMDLERLGLAALGARFLDAYLAQTGDYPGLRVLRFYCVYRAMVRAKVASIRAHQVDLDERDRSGARAQLSQHLALAKRLARGTRPALILMHGLSGSGKTTVSESIVERLGAIRLRSDVERKRLHGMDPGAASASAPGAGLYTRRENERTYERLAELACYALAAGYPVVVDAAFLERERRDAFRALASAAGVPFAIASCDAPLAVLRGRVEARERSGAGASEAGPDVLDFQLAGRAPLASDETAHAVAVDTTRDSAGAEAGASLARRLHLGRA
jgi:hypothetical protein